MILIDLFFNILLFALRLIEKELKERLNEIVGATPSSN